MLSSPAIISERFSEKHISRQYFDINWHTWEQRKFEDIAKRRSDSTISSNSLPCVEYEDVISEQGTLNKDISQKELAKTGIEFESGDVLFGKLRPYLKNWLLPDFNGVAVGDWWVLKPVSTDGNFLYRLIQTSEFMGAFKNLRGYHSHLSQKSLYT